MPETPRYKLPYPDYLKANDIPGDLLALVQRLEASMHQVGDMIPTFNKIAPAGRLMMKGQVVTRSVWSLLADLWGIPSNVLSFVIPDMTGVTVMGAATDAQIGTLAGANSRTISVSHMPPHGHPFAPNLIQLNDPGHIHPIDLAQGKLFIESPNEEQRYLPNRHSQPPIPPGFLHATMTLPSKATTGITVNQSTTGGTVGNTGSGLPLDTTPRHLKINWMVVAA